MPEVTEPLKLGTRTQWGKIGAVSWISGERYYWMVDRIGSSCHDARLLR